MEAHKYAELLRYAADNADALFISELYEEAFAERKRSPTKIGSVISYAGFDDWRIFNEPVIEVIWYFMHSDKTMCQTMPGVDNWFMKITYIDGKPNKAEFAE